MHLEFEWFFFFFLPTCRELQPGSFSPYHQTVCAVIQSDPGLIGSCSRQEGRCFSFTAILQGRHQSVTVHEDHFTWLMGAGTHALPSLLPLGGNQTWKEESFDTQTAHHGLFVTFSMSQSSVLWWFHQKPVMVFLRGLQGPLGPLAGVFDLIKSYYILWFLGLALLLIEVICVNWKALSNRRTVWGFSSPGPVGNAAQLVGPMQTCHTRLGTVNNLLLNRSSASSSWEVLLM